jgi:hypothetical protein
MVPQADQSTETKGRADGQRAARNPDMMRSAEAARYIDMSDSWLRQSRMNGRTDGPPFLRQGARAIRYRRHDLDRWLELRLCHGVTAPAMEAPARRAPTRARLKGKRRRPTR